jgi:uncharacterized phage protein gp47/JayE
MSDYGVVESGFIAKPLTQILSEIEADEKAALGDTIDFSPQESLGQLNGIFSERVSEVWQLAQAIYDAFDPSAASAAQLDALCALTGTVRQQATPTRVIGVCSGTAGTLLLVGRVASIPVVGSKFASAKAVTIAALDAWLTGVYYPAGYYVSSNGKSFRSVGAGTSGATAPAGATALGATCSDGTVTWRCVGTNTAAVEVEFDAQVAGPVPANAGTLTTIESQVSGWDSVFNPEDPYKAGTALETDALLRLRRAVELNAQGNAVLEAIRQRILKVDQVQGAYVFENTTDVTDSDGLPPHSIEAVVLGGDDQDIADALFACVGAGIASNGTTTKTVVDQEGVSHDVSFSRPDVLAVYVTISLTYDPSVWPGTPLPSGQIDGVARIIAALLSYGASSLVNGKDVVAAALLAQVFTVPGVLDCQLPHIGTAPAPGTSTTIPVSLRQLAQLDSSRISVVTTPGTP